jgi:hypothetical protein
MIYEHIEVLYTSTLGVGALVPARRAARVLYVLYSTIIIYIDVVALIP